MSTRSCSGYLAIVFVFSLIFSSCLKETIDGLSDIKGVSANPEFSAPLINSSIGMKEIYESYSDKAIIREQSDKLLVFVFQSSDTVNPDPFVEIPTTPFSFTLQMNPLVIAGFEATGGTTFQLNDSVKLDLTNGEKIKSIHVKDGNLNFSFTSEFRHNFTITVTYPTIKRNGNAISEVIDINYDPNDYPKVVTREISLDDAVIDFSRGGVTANSLPFDYTISATRIPTNATLPTERFIFNQTFDLNSFNTITGYLGKFEVLSADQSQDIDLFDKGLSGQVFLKDPRLTIRVSNTLGVPVTGRITNLRVVDQNNQSIPVTVNPFRDTFTFATPARPGEIATSEYIIDRTNSNIADALNSKPKFVRFSMKFDANYRQEEKDNFLTDETAFYTYYNSEIPFDLKVLNYDISSVQSNSTLKDIGDIGDQIQQVKMNVITENGLPFDMYAQMLFSRDSILPNGDTLQAVIDSLFTTEIPVLGALVDANSEVIRSSTSSTQVVLNVQRFERIQSAPNNVMRIRVNTSQINGAPAFVKIYSNQRLSMKIGADIKLKLSTK